jgi:hypothetical protein
MRHTWSGLGAHWRSREGSTREPIAPISGSDQLGLRAAQQAIAGNWYAAYQRYVRQASQPGRPFNSIAGALLIPLWGSPRLAC